MYKNLKYSNTDFFFLFTSSFQKKFRLEFENKSEARIQLHLTPSTCMSLEIEQNKIICKTKIPVKSDWYYYYIMESIIYEIIKSIVLHMMWCVELRGTNLIYSHGWTWVAVLAWAMGGSWSIRVHCRHCMSFVDECKDKCHHWMTVLRSLLCRKFCAIVGMLSSIYRIDLITLGISCLFPFSLKMENNIFLGYAS